MFRLSKRSLRKLDGVHPDLVSVVKEAIKETRTDFSVIFGVRTAEEQNELYQKGRTKPGSIVTYRDGYQKKSNHQPKSDGFGHAVDLVVYNDGLDWNDIDGYKEIARAMFESARLLGVSIRWGADWDRDGDNSDERFLDWAHFELYDN